MFEIRRSNQRGHFNFGWLDTYHSFSFGEYYDPKFMGFGNLRVLNQDMVQPNAGFPEHHHDNMEIVSYILSGKLEHKDNMGNGSIMRPGDVQYMSAGTGVTHSEFNTSSEDVVKFLQLWLLPNQDNLTPQYQQISLSREAKLNKWCCIAAPEQLPDALQIASDSSIYVTILQPLHILGKKVVHKHAWLQVISGTIMLETEVLQAGDGAALIDESELNLISAQDAELMLIEC